MVFLIKRDVINCKNIINLIIFSRNIIKNANYIVITYIIVDKV